MTSWEKLRELFSRWGGGIRGRLLWVGLFFLAVALLTNTIAGSIYTRRQIKKTAATLQAEVALRVARDIGEFMRRKMERLSDLSVTLSLHELGSEEQRLFALLLLKNDRSFTDISILDDKGTEVVKVSERKVYLPSELTDQSASERFKRVIKGESYVSPVYTSDKAEPYVTMAVPVKVTPKLVIGVVIAETNLKFLWEVIGEVEFGKAGYAYLVDGQGNLIAHQDPSLVLKKTNLSHIHGVEDFLRSPTSVDPSPAEENIGILGKPVLSTFAPVRELGSAVILEEPVDLAWAEVRTMERYAYLLLGLGLLVGAAIIIWVSNQITKPIRELHRGADIIGEGNLDHRVTIKTGDEIEQLAEGFNKMAVELKTSYATLEERVKQRTHELSALYDVTTTVNQSLEIEPVLQEVIKKVNEIFHFDATRIFLFNAQMDELHLRASFESRPEFFYEAGSFRRGQGVIGRVAETGEAIIFEDALTDPRYQEMSQSKATKKAGLSFFAVFPIKTKARCVGTILFLGQYPRKLTFDEVRLLTSVAEQIGVAVENARLHEETVSRARELSALYDVTATVNQSLEIDPVLQEVIRKITEIFNFDTMRLYLFDGQMEVLHVRAAYPADREDLPRVRAFRRGQGIVGKVAETGEPMIFEDILSDSRYRELSSTKNTQMTGFRFFAVVPIKSRFKTVGVFICNGQTPRRLTSDEVRLVTSMAEQIGVAVEHARLFEQAVKRAKELDALNALAATINRSLDLEFVLREAIEKVTEILQFDAAWLHLIESSGKELHLRAQKGISVEFSQAIARRRLGEGFAGNVAKAGESLVFEDIQTDPRYPKISVGRLALSAGFRAEGCFPIKSRGGVLGSLTLANYNSHHFSSGELQLIGSIANEIGVAVENATLFEEVKVKSQQLGVLVEINKDIAGLLDRDVLLPHIAVQAKKVLDVEGCIFRLIEGEDLVLLTASEPEAELGFRRKLKIGESFAGEIVRQNRPLAVKRPWEDPRLIEEHREIVLQAGYSSFLGVPMRVGERVIGTLTLYSKAERDFKAEELRLITAFADQAAIAIQNANLFAEVRQKTAELEGANRELVEVSRAKSEFMAAMSHELRTPLNVIIGNADLIKDGFFGVLTEKQREALEKILRYSQMLLKLITDVLALTRIEAKKMTLDLSTFRVEDIINNIVAYADQVNHDRHLEVLWDVEENLLPMTTDALKLEEILQNLIGNAFKFTPKGRIEVRVRNLGGGGQVEFTVADTGIGIERDALDKIFEQFYQLRDAHTGSYSGVGLGLSIVKRYLEIMQGDIHVESQSKKGSTFTFTLPYTPSATPV